MEAAQNEEHLLMACLSLCLLLVSILSMPFWISVLATFCDVVVGPIGLSLAVRTRPTLPDCSSIEPFFDCGLVLEEQNCGRNISAIVVHNLHKMHVLHCKSFCNASTSMVPSWQSPCCEKYEPKIRDLWSDAIGASVWFVSASNVAVKSTCACVSASWVLPGPFFSWPHDAECL